MSKTVSLFLDVLRFAAAMTVVLGHCTQARFSRIGPDRTGAAIAAVAVFFVISGFVISHVVSTSETSAIEYAAARIGRIYSVLVPAIVLSSLVLLFALVRLPGYVSAMGMTSAAAVVGHSLLPLTFLNSCHNTLNSWYPPLDSPIWSLGFEAAYYALFGIAMFSAGWLRLVLLLVVAMAVGATVLHLLPVWLAGVAVQRILPRLRFQRATSYLLGTLCLVFAGLAVWRWSAFEAWSASPHGALLNALLHAGAHVASADVFYYWGVITCLLIAGVAWLDAPVGRLLQPLERPIRWLAAHTFSLYLFHLPLFVFLYVAFQYDRSSLRSVAVIFCADVVLCTMLSTIGENQKLRWRRLITRLLSHLLSPFHTAAHLSPIP